MMYRGISVAHTLIIGMGLLLVSEHTAATTEPSAQGSLPSGNFSGGPYGTTGTGTPGFPSFPGSNGYPPSFPGGYPGPGSQGGFPPNGMVAAPPVQKKKDKKEDSQKKESFFGGLFARAKEANVAQQAKAGLANMAGGMAQKAVDMAKKSAKEMASNALSGSFSAYPNAKNPNTPYQWGGPSVPTPSPVYTPAPAPVQAPAPVYAPAPTSAPAPVYAPPAPVYAPSTPGVQAPPVYAAAPTSAPAPVYAPPAPGVQAPPTIPRPAPTSAPAPAPVYAPPAPVYAPPAPVYAPSAPGVQAPPTIPTAPLPLYAQPSMAQGMPQGIFPQTPFNPLNLYTSQGSPGLSLLSTVPSQEEGKAFSCDNCLTPTYLMTHQQKCSQYCTMAKKPDYGTPFNNVNSYGFDSFNAEAPSLFSEDDLPSLGDTGRRSSDTDLWNSLDRQGFSGRPRGFDSWDRGRESYGDQERSSRLMQSRDDGYRHPDFSRDSFYNTRSPYESPYNPPPPASESGYPFQSPYDGSYERRKEFSGNGAPVSRASTHHDRSSPGSPMVFPPHPFADSRDPSPYTYGRENEVSNRGFQPPHPFADSRDPSPYAYGRENGVSNRGFQPSYGPPPMNPSPYSYPPPYPYGYGPGYPEPIGDPRGSLRGSYEWGPPPSFEPRDKSQKTKRPQKAHPRYKPSELESQKQTLQEDDKDNDKEDDEDNSDSQEE